MLQQLRASCQPGLQAEASNQAAAELLEADQLLSWLVKERAAFVAYNLAKQPCLAQTHGWDFSALAAGALPALKHTDLPQAC